MEDYLRSLDNKEISEIIDNGAEMGDNFYPDSGDVFKWVSVLRAADYLWSNDSKFGFVRLAEEGVFGTSPQIIVTCWNRLVFLKVLVSPPM